MTGCDCLLPVDPVPDDPEPLLSCPILAWDPVLSSELALLFMLALIEFVRETLLNPLCRSSMLCLISSLSVPRRFVFGEFTAFLNDSFLFAFSLNSSCIFWFIVLLPNSTLFALFCSFWLLYLYGLLFSFLFRFSPSSS